MGRQGGAGTAEPVDGVELQSKSQEALPVVEMIHNFGIATVNAAQTHQFRISNGTTSPWHLVEIRSDCTCTVAKPSSLIVEPGREITVPVTFKGATESIDVARKVVLHFAERGAPQIILRIKGKVREPLTLYPKALHFDVYGVQADQRSSAQIDNFTSKAWSGLRLANVPEWLHISQELVSKAQDGHPGQRNSEPRQRWKLVLSPSRSLLPRLPFGVHETRITVSAVESDASSTMVVRLRRHRLLEAVPSDLFFGEVAPGECNSVSAIIVDRRPIDAQNEGPIPGPSIQKPSDARLECSLESHAGSAWRFRVTFRADRLQGYASGNVKVSFGADDDLCVNLPCHVRVVKRPQG